MIKQIFFPDYFYFGSDIEFAQRENNDVFYKRFREDKYDKFIKSLFILEKLQNEDFIPKLLHYTNNLEIYTSDCGNLLTINTLPDDWEKQLVEIKKKLPSRIIFSGNEGIGKSTLSFHLTNYLLSLNEKTKYNLANNEINLESLSHNHVIKQSHPNFYYISKLDGKTNIEIDQVRDMITFINKSSFNDNKKIILIDGVEYLNQNSSNALLKCLEESNDQNLFILTYNINQRILDTIKSRCISYKLNFDYSTVPNIISHNFGENLYEELNQDFKFETISPNFIIKHITFALENSLNINSLNVNNMIKYIIDTKSYKKDPFIINNFQYLILLEALF